jgi:hypothetical protein
LYANGQNSLPLDNPNKAFEGKNVLTLEVPCFKSLDPVHVVNALNCGFDGVMAVVCSAKDCKLQEGRATAAERNLAVMLQRFTEKEWVCWTDSTLYEESPRCAGEFNAEAGCVLQERYVSITQKRNS